jgi:hypothetical protein
MVRGVSGVSRGRFYTISTGSHSEQGLTSGQLLYTIAIAQLPLGWWYTPHFPLLITEVIFFRQYSMSSLSIQSKASFSLLLHEPAFFVVIGASAGVGGDFP